MKTPLKGFLELMFVYYLWATIEYKLWMKEQNYKYSYLYLYIKKKTEWKSHFISANRLLWIGPLPGFQQLLLGQDICCFYQNWFSITKFCLMTQIIIFPFLSNPNLFLKAHYFLPLRRQQKPLYSAFLFCVFKIYLAQMEVKQWLRPCPPCG